MSWSAVTDAEGGTGIAVHPALDQVRFPDVDALFFFQYYV